MIAVALGGIDQVHAQLTRPAHQPVDLVLREVLSPLAAELPSAQPDHRQTGSPVLPNRRYSMISASRRDCLVVPHRHQRPQTWW